MRINQLVDEEEGLYLDFNVSDDVYEAIIKEVGRCPYIIHSYGHRYIDNKEYIYFEIQITEHSKIKEYLIEK